MTLFYLNIFSIGLFGTVFIRKFFGYSVETSYVFGRLAGLLILAYIIWFLGAVDVVSFSSSSIWVIYLILIFTALCFSRDLSLRESLGKILKLELVYFLPFAFITIYLFVFPDIINGEKYMNFGIFNSLLNFDVLPPKDMWLAPYSLNYYYFGHLVYTIPAKMFSYQPGVAFNIVLSTIFGLVFLQVYYFVYELTAKIKYAFLGGFFVCFAGNLFPVLYFLLNPTGDVSVIQRSVRFIPDAINDFPSYSFFLGGLHSHVFGLPGVILFLYLLYKLYVSGTKLKLHLLVLSFLLGAMYVTNSWDFLVYAFFLGLVLAAFMKLRVLLLTYTIIIFGSLLFFVPYHLTVVSSAIYGIGYVGTPSGPIRLVAMFGVFFLLGIPWMLQRLPMVFRKGFRTLDKTDSYIFLMILASLLIVFSTEILYIKDLLAVENFSQRRSNTVYKFWYEAWIMFSIAIPYVLYKVLSFRNSFYKPTLLVVLGVLSLTVIYPTYNFVATYYNRVHTVENPVITLDGTKYLFKDFPDIYNGIAYLKTLDRDVVLLEPPGEQYGENHSIFSSYTGVPSVLGWYNHERVWRGAPPEIYERLYDIKKMYLGTDSNEVAKLLQMYEVDYVVINDHARELYGNLAGNSVRPFAVTTYKNDSIEFLKIANLPGRSQQ